MSNPKRRAVDVLSLCLLAGMHLSCGLVFVVPFGWRLVALAAGSYLLRMFAVTAGFHRYFSHRAYRTSRAFQFVLGLLGTMSMQNGPLWWASFHRRHHRYADTPRDPHSPRVLGFWQAHLGWALAGTDNEFSNIPDLTRFPELVFLERHRWLPLVAYALGCFAIAGWGGVVWGFVLSTILVFHATLLINSMAHVWGTRRYATPDDSRNNALLALITLGEGWHNNHHHHMSSARQGFRWWEFDPSYYVIRLLAGLGLVWDVREPNARVLRANLIAADGNTNPTRMRERATTEASTRGVVRRLPARQRQPNEEKHDMNWEEVTTEWTRLAPQLKSKWGKLTDEDLTAAGNKRDLLVSALERHYGIQRKHAELQLDRWVSVLKPAPAAADASSGGDAGVKARP